MQGEDSDFEGKKEIEGGLDGKESFICFAFEKAGAIIDDIVAVEVRMKTGMT